MEAKIRVDALNNGPLASRYMREAEKTVQNEDHSLSKVLAWKPLEAVCITRHPALVEFLRGRGVIGPETPVVEHATKADVAGKVVVGVLPISLAAEAALVIEVPINLPLELRGKELSTSDMERCAGEPQAYQVQRRPDLYLDLGDE